MQVPTLTAIFFIALSSMNTGAMSQTIYKCGAAYSELPCSGGVVVDATDKRSAAQKAQADAASALAATRAQAMAKTRLQQEKKDLTANTPPATPIAANTSSKHIKAQTRKKKKQEPENFTAQVPGEKKKGKPRKTDSQKENKSTS